MDWPEVIDTFIFNRSRCRSPGSQWSWAYLDTAGLQEVRETAIYHAQVNERRGERSAAIDALEGIFGEFERPWRDWQSWPWG